MDARVLRRRRPPHRAPAVLLRDAGVLTVARRLTVLADASGRALGEFYREGVERDIRVAAAVAVSPGTTVTWRWTGKGGSHNVRSESDAFDSGYSDHAGHEFSHTFEDPRIYKYQCDPHAMMGMRGAVVVALE